MRTEKPVLVCSAGILFFSFFLDPKIDPVSVLIILGVWCVSMSWDLKTTFAYKDCIPRHERSIILSHIYKRLPDPAAILLTVAAESACVVFLPYMIFLEINTGASMSVAYFFALLHIVAMQANEEFASRLGLQRHMGA